MAELNRQLAERGFAVDLDLEPKARSALAERISAHKCTSGRCCNQEGNCQFVGCVGSIARVWFIRQMQTHLPDTPMEQRHNSLLAIIL